MTFHERPSKRSWLISSSLGIAVGTVVLGVGSRIAMRGIVVLTGGTPSFSISGSATVVFLGALAGLAGALVLLGLRWALPLRPVLRGIVFWLFLMAVALRGLRPLDAPRLFLFVPLVLVYGILLHVFSCRFESRVGAQDSASVRAAA